MPNITFTETIIPAHNVRSLAWRGDTLVDWVAGGVVYHLDGAIPPAIRAPFEQYDSATASPGGGYAVVYERIGTSALLLRDGQVVRQLKRDPYCANVHEYPVCLFEHEGRTLLAHCPEAYGRIEIDDAATGERLTRRESEPIDFFHSRLAVSPDGDRLLSAGWFWQPWDAVLWFDIAAALREPGHLDSINGCTEYSRNIGLAEEASACWQTGSTILITGSDEPEDPEEGAEGATDRLRPLGIIAYDIVGRTIRSSCVLEQPAGRVMAVGLEHAVAFFQHPRLVRLSDGIVEHAWPHIASGTQTSSIIWSQRFPVMALDSPNMRFAIVQEDGIHVVQIQVEAGDTA